MTELMRPASIRELVQKLPRPSLIYLCEQRGRPISRANDDCRSSISRSFRGQRDDLLALLRKEELVLLLRLPVRSGNLVFELPDVHTYAKRELQELAKLAFGSAGHLGEPFVVQRHGGATPATRQASTPLEVAGYAVEGEAPTTVRGIGRPVALEAASDDSLAGHDSTRSSPAEGSGEWTRPRPVRSLFAQIGLPVPSELEQVEFAALIEALELRGFEVATGDGARLTPLHDAVSIDAEVRMRHDAFAASHASFHRANRDLREDFAIGRPVELGDYERASLRLELLLAGASSDDEADEVLARAVDIAAAGLVIQPPEHLLLGRVAAALARARRDPLVVLTSLVRRLDSEDGEVLLREYASLRSVTDDLHTTLSEHWAALNRSS